MINQDIIAQDLFYKIRSRFPKMEMGDQKGAPTFEATKGRFFDFDAVFEEQNLGTVSISINEPGSLKLYFNRNILENADSIVSKTWYNFLKEMRRFAMKRLMSFDTRDVSKSNLDKRDYHYLAKKESVMNESSYSGSKYMSFRPLEKTKLIIRHRKDRGPVDESIPGARSRNIEALFIENADGERFKYPFVHKVGAECMQRHVANGGAPHDPLGQQIVEMSSDIAKLKAFKHYVQKEDLMNNDTNHIVDRANQRLESLKQSMHKLSKQHHYEAWKNQASVGTGKSQPLIDEITMEEYKDKFTVKNFKEDIADVFPLIYSIMQEADELDLNEVVKESMGKGVVINGKEVDLQSLEIDGVDTRDYPDLVDAYISAGSFVDGTEMSDDELTQLEDQYGDIVHELALDSLHENIRPEQAFESWANTLVETRLSPEDLDVLKGLVSEHFPVGINANNVTSALEQLGIDLDPNTEHQLQELSVNPDADASQVVLEFLSRSEPEIFQAIGVEMKESNLSEPLVPKKVEPEEPAPTTDQETGPNAPKPEAPIQDSYYLGPEDLPEWKADAAERVANGEVDSWTELYAELVSDLGLDEKRAELIAKGVFGRGNTAPSAQEPDDEIDALDPLDDEEDDDAFLSSLRGSIGRHGTIGHEVDEEDKLDSPDDHDDDMVKSKKSDSKEIAKFIMGFYDRETGHFPLGETGVSIKVEKQFGDKAAELAERLIQSLAAKGEQHKELSDIRRLSGLHSGEVEEGNLSEPLVLTKPKPADEIDNAVKTVHLRNEPDPDHEPAAPGFAQKLRSLPPVDQDGNLVDLGSDESPKTDTAPQKPENESIDFSTMLRLAGLRK